MRLGAIALLSGGMDSCVTAAIAAMENEAVGALHVAYGQRTAAREREAAEAVFQELGLAAWKFAEIGYLADIGGSSLTDPEIPVSLAELSSDALPTSYVPFRNTHLLSIATSWAEVSGARRIYIGAVEEDSSGYPDCRRSYFDQFERLVSEGSTMADLRVLTPLISMTKADIVRKGLEIEAPLHLTWSCYSNQDLACGVCDSCALRLRGFARAGIEDPIPYAVRPDYRS